MAVPKPRPFKVPLAYVIAGRDDAMAETVDTWIDLKRKDGTIDELFAHWILGQNASPDSAAVVGPGRAAAPGAVTRTHGLDRPVGGDSGVTETDPGVARS